MMVVDIKNIVTRLPELRFTTPVNWRIDEGQQWAVIGPNGAGKTLIADIMQRKFAFKEGEVVFSGDGKVSDFIKSIAFKDIYSLADCRNSYYQQRWHSTETEEMPIVEELLKEYAGSDNLAKILTLFGIEDLLPKRLIFLSSGELRKFLIVRTLLSRPRVLILDNPFIGLDAPSRDLLVEMLGQMTKLNGVQVVLLLSNPNDIPAMITHVLPIHDCTCLPPLTREEFMSDTELIARLFPTEGIHACEEVGKVRLPVDMNKIASLHEVTLRMEHVKIRYGSRTILKDLDWEIKNGEKWALFGPNGAGKSTLLSLVYADNPQSYAVINHLMYLDHFLTTHHLRDEHLWDYFFSTLHVLWRTLKNEIHHKSCYQAFIQLVTIRKNPTIRQLVREVPFSVRMARKLKIQKTALWLLLRL